MNHRSSILNTSKFVFLFIPLWTPSCYVSNFCRILHNKRNQIAVNQQFVDSSFPRYIKQWTDDTAKIRWSRHYQLLVCKYSFNASDNYIKESFVVDERLELLLIGSDWKFSEYNQNHLGKNSIVRFIFIIIGTLFFFFLIFIIIIKSCL